jgi:DNA-binding Lrp family transcriptional regulator
MTDGSIARNLTDRLSEKQVLALIELIRDGRVTDAKLMESLKLGDATSAGYHRKTLEKDGVIENYTAEIDWRKLGYPTEFIILCEGKGSRALYEMEKDYVSSVEDYLKREGEILVSSTTGGKVLVRDVFYCLGERAMTVIRGHATSDHDVLEYSRQHLLKYPDIETTTLTMKSKCKVIKNFFIQRECLEAFKRSL